jgi:hypothetical protein
MRCSNIARGECQIDEIPHTSRRLGGAHPLFILDIFWVWVAGELKVDYYPGIKRKRLKKAALWVIHSENGKKNVDGCLNRYCHPPFGPNMVFFRVHGNEKDRGRDWAYIEARVSGSSWVPFYSVSSS